MGWAGTGDAASPNRGYAAPASTGIPGTGRRVSGQDVHHRSATERNPMTKLDFYGIDAIHLKETEELLPGRLIVIEGTDGVGRSTQLSILRPWLESSGFAVVDTEMTRSVLAGAGLKRAKEGHTLGPINLQPFYSNDFVDRFTHQSLT